MSGGGFIDPVAGGYGYGPGLAGSGIGQWAGGLGMKLRQGFESVFGNQEVAAGVRDIMGNVRGGNPLVGVGPGWDPALVPDLPDAGYGVRLPGDWDANAWRPSGASRFADPFARTYAQPGLASRYADPALGSRYADPALGSRYADPAYGSRYADPTYGRSYGQPGLDPYGDPALGGSTWRQGLAQIGRGMLSGAKSGAIFSGIFSALINGYKVITRQEQFSGAAGAVVADTASGAVSGATGALASGVALAVATAAGMTVGLPLTLLGIAAGLGGAFLGSWIFKRTGLYGGIRNAVTRLFGGSSLGNSVGREIPINQPGGSIFGFPSSNVGGMVPGPGSNIGRLIPLH